MIIKNVTLLNHSILPKKDFKTAYNYCKDIDVDDTFFVGFSEYLGAKLWTGDKELTQGLKAKGFKRIIDTQELLKDFINKRNNKNR